MSDETLPPTHDLTSRSNVIPFGKTRNRKGQLVDDDKVYGEATDVDTKDQRGGPDNFLGRKPTKRLVGKKLNDRSGSNANEETRPKNLKDSENNESKPGDKLKPPEISQNSISYGTQSKDRSEGSNEIVTSPRGYSSLNRTVKQLNRQEKVFELSVLYGLSNVAIAAELGISNLTVASDLKAELALREAEFTETRDQEKVRQLMHVQELINAGRESRNNPGTGAFAAWSKALEMRAKLLGLDAPTKMEVGVTHLLEAIDTLPPARQKEAWTKVVSGDTPTEYQERVSLPPSALPSSLREEDFNSQERTPSQAILEAVVVGPIVDETATPLERIYKEGAQQDSPAETATSAASRRAEQVKSAMGDPDADRTRKAIPADPILLQSQEVHRSAVAAAQERLADREASLTVAHEPNTPAMNQTQTKVEASTDKAASILASDWFYTLSPATQVELLATVRGTASGTQDGKSTED